MTVGAAVLSHGVCISDVMNKAGMCDKSVSHITNQH